MANIYTKTPKGANRGGIAAAFIPIAYHKKKSLRVKLAFDSQVIPISEGIEIELNREDLKALRAIMKSGG
jgi:hypothetical protein